MSAASPAVGWVGEGASRRSLCHGLGRMVNNLTMPAGLTDHGWAVREGLLYRGPPRPQPAGGWATRGGGSGQGKEPKQTTCVRMAGVESVTRSERATGIPWAPSCLYLFVPMKGQRVGMGYLAAECRYTTWYSMRFGLTKCVA